MSFSAIMLMHMSAATCALVSGSIVMAGSKGNVRHRMLGRFWVVAMLVTAVSSFGIRTSGGFSWIHLLSIWLIFSIAIAVRAIRQGDIQRHLRWMRGSYVSLLFAGIFTLLPQRRLGNLLWQATGLG